MQMKNATVLLGLLAVAATGARAQDKKDIVVGGRAKVRAEITFAPVLHIQLGVGAKNKESDADVVQLDLNSAEDYSKGTEPKSVKRQLYVFAMGTPWSVDADLVVRGAKGNPSNNLFYKILQMSLGAIDHPVKLVDASPKMANIYNGKPSGFRHLDAAYAIKPLTPENIRLVNGLLGKDGQAKTFTIDIVYTIAAR